MIFTPKNPDFKQTILHHLQKQEFMKAIGCKLTVIEPGYVEAEIELSLMHQQQIGLVHGGVTATIADIAAGFAGFTLVAEHEHTVTAEIKISFLRKGIGSSLRSVGRVLKAGHTLQFCEAEVYCKRFDGTEELIAHATTTLAIIVPKL